MYSPPEQLVISKQNCPVFAKLSGLHLFSSPVLSLLSSSNPSSTSPLFTSPYLSPLKKQTNNNNNNNKNNLTSFQEPAKLHCDMTLISQLEWPTGYDLTTLKLQRCDNSFSCSSYKTTNYLYYIPKSVQKHPVSFN